MNNADLERVGHSDLIDWLVSHGGRLIVSGGQAVRVREAEGFSREENNGNFKSLLELDPGRILAFHWPFRNSDLTIITTSDRGKPGGCVRITVAEKREGGDWKTIKPQKAIAAMLGLKHDETFGPGKAYRLQVVEDYLKVVKRSGPELTAKEASRRLRGLLE